MDLKAVTTTSPQCLNNFVTSTMELKAVPVGCVSRSVSQQTARYYEKYGYEYGSELQLAANSSRAGWHLSGSMPQSIVQSLS